MKSNNTEKLLGEFGNPYITNGTRTVVVEHLKKSAESMEVSERVKAVMNGAAIARIIDDFDNILKEAEKRDKK